MNFDLRFPLGLIFTAFGALLVIAGALSSPSAYAKSLGINVNLDWGAVVLAFGLVMLLLAFRAARRK